SDKADAQSDEHPGERILLRFFNTSMDVLRGLFAHALELHQLFDGEVINIRHALDQAAVDELIDESVAHAIDIHDRPGCEMADRFLEPRGTVGVDAARGGLVLFSDDVSATDRAVLRHAEGVAAFALLSDTHDFRDHVAAALDQDFIA